MLTRGVGESESIVIELKFYLSIASKRRLITCHLKIGLESREPVVRREILSYKRACRRETRKPKSWAPRSGDNLPSGALRLKEEHPEIFETVLQKVRDRVPGISDIEARTSEDGGVLIRYADHTFQDLF